MVSGTNQSKTTVSPYNTVKTRNAQAVYGMGYYGLAVYGVGVAGFGAITNLVKHSISPTNQTKH